MTNRNGCQRAWDGFEAQFRYQPPPVTFTSAAHACIVEVDARPAS